MADTYPNYHGATVEYESYENGAHRFRSVLPFPNHPKGRIVVTTSAGAHVDPQHVYNVNKRDVLAEALAFAPADDREAWQRRLEAAHKPVRAAQILNPYSAGAMPVSMAIERLVAAGHSASEAAALIDAAPAPAAVEGESA